MTVVFNLVYLFILNIIIKFNKTFFLIINMIYIHNITAWKSIFYILIHEYKLCFDCKDRIQTFDGMMLRNVVHMCQQVLNECI